jgi:hypothetical protein
LELGSEIALWYGRERYLREGCSEERELRLVYTVEVDSEKRREDVAYGRVYLL